MELAMRILRRFAAIVNGLCVLAVLALLVPGVTLRAAAEWQNTPNPVLFGYTVAVVEDDAMAPMLEEGSLVLLGQPERPYILDDFTACRLDGRTVFGIVLASRGTDFDLGVPKEKTVLAEGIPLNAMLGEVDTVIPVCGAWLDFARTDKGLLLLVAAGVLLVELPRVLRPRKKGEPLFDETDDEDEEDGTEGEEVGGNDKK